MKPFILVLGIAMAATAVSCDKIAEDQYTLFAGAAGTWYDSDASIPTVQRAFVEKYTGVRCINCPKADEVLHSSVEKYGDQLIVAAVHVPNNYGKPFRDEPDLRTEKGNTWFNTFFSPSQSLPAALLNRTETSAGTLDVITPTARFDDRIDAILNQAPQVSLLLQSGQEEGKYIADVFLQFEQTVTDSLTLTLLVVEDKIYTSQDCSTDSGTVKLTNYEQNHVLRDVLTDAWGINVDADGQQGTCRRVRLAFDLREECLPANCQLIAFVSNKNTRYIINAAQCALM